MLAVCTVLVATHKGVSIVRFVDCGSFTGLGCKLYECTW